MRPEYDEAVLKGGVRGKYAKRFASGTNPVHIDPPVAAAFSAQLYIILGGVLLLLLLVGGVALLLVGGGDGEPGPGKVAVKVTDEPDHNKKQDKGAVAGPVTTSKIEDEPDEVIGPKGAVTFKIDDEPEERLKGVAAPQPVKVEIKDEPEEVRPGGAAVNAPVDPMPRVVYQYGQNMRFGITALTDANGTPLNKRITYSHDGTTSNTRMKINGADGEYGEPGGRWLVRNKRIADNPALQSRNGSVSVLAVGNLRISQTVEIVPSKQPVMVGGQPKRLLVTVLVRYLVENNDSRSHSVGLRAQVDTLIGNNDGVPFTVPGFPGLVDSMADFRTTREVPPFIQALEFPNLRAPGTVALMTLKPGGNLEPPGRVSLTHWLGGAPWEVPVVHMGSDSAVIIYWNEKTMRPGQKRQFGYAYGLGRVDAGEAGGRLGITLNGDFDPGKTFTVTALVTNPVPGQTVALEVPQGLAIQGAAKAKVPRGQGRPPTSVVTWNVKVQRPGEFRIRVASSTGQAQSKTITIVQPEGQAVGKLALEIQGRSFEPGETFTVLAKVTPPVRGQTLKLSIPRGLECVEGQPEQSVPAAGGPDGASTVAWKVKIGMPGRFPVRVESSTGVAQTKTLTIVPQDLGGGRFRVALGGEFAPGKEFTMTAHVVDPVEKQTLTLKLPAELQRVSGAELQDVPPAPKGQSTKVQWTVKVPQAGKFKVGVASSTGVTQWKTLTIENVAAGGKFAFDLTGEIKPGKVFFVVAKVTDPAKGQTLSLKLESGKLERVDGAESQEVTPVAPGWGEVRWTVRVLAQEGELRVRVESSTGLARTKRITLAKVQGKEGIFD
jgi:hypothetical protein